MTTSWLRQVSIAFAGTLGLFLGAAACGSGAERTASPEGPSALDHRGALASRPDPGHDAKLSRLALQDPPPRPTTKEQCDACQGLWAAHGIEPEETCICKANDEGRECTDGKDCAGECLLDDDAEFHVMDPGTPERGYYKGHCASYDTTFGCFRHIPDDIQSHLPLAPEEAGEFICVD
jgi:hypothetical protein